MTDRADAPKLGRWMTTSLVVGTMIGSGIFLLPAALAPYGWNALLGWGLTIGGALCVAAVLAWLARIVPGECGPYAYAGTAFGPLAGHLVAWAYWVSVWTGNAAIAVAGIAYLSVFAPSLAVNPVLGAAAASILLWALTANQLYGVRRAGALQLLTTIVKLVPLIAVVLIAIGVLAGGGDVSGLSQSRAPVSPALLAAAATLSLWSLVGLETATVPAERIHDPGRTVPFALIAGTALTGIVYLATSAAILLLMPAGELAGSNAPFADFIARFWRPEAGAAIALFAAVSCAGALNGLIIAGGEMPLAMARGGGFPRWFAAVSSRGVPVRALILSGLLANFVILLNYAQSLVALFTFLILLSTASTLFLYLGSTLALLRLRTRIGRSRLLLPVAALAGAYALWALYGAGGEAVGWGVLLLLAGIPVFVACRRVKES